MSPNLDKDRSSRTPVIVRVIIRTIQHRQTPTKHNIVLMITRTMTGVRDERSPADREVIYLSRLVPELRARAMSFVKQYD